MATIEYPHITVLPGEVPVLTGTQTKVVEIVLDHLAHGWDAAEIQREHPHLTPAQIHAALTYYYDHRAEIDQDIERRLAVIERLEAETGTSPVRLKLRALGQLP